MDWDSILCSFALYMQEAQKSILAERERQEMLHRVEASMSALSYKKLCGIYSGNMALYYIKLDIPCWLSITLYYNKQDIVSNLIIILLAETWPPTTLSDRVRILLRYFKWGKNISKRFTFCPMIPYIFTNLCF